MGLELTPRQEAVYQLLNDPRRLTQAEIAEQLEISVRTVEHHLARIRAKLDAGTTRAALRARARDRGHRTAPLRVSH